MHTSHSWLRLRRVLLGLGLIAGLVGVTPPLHADGDFVINAIYSRNVDGVIRIDADVRYNLTPVLRDALHNGVDLVIEMEVRVERVRWWVNEDVASLVQRYRLGYYSLSRLYVVQNLNTGVQSTYPSLGSALYALGAVRDFPLMDAALLLPGEEYRAGMRTRLAVDQLPLPLRVRGYVAREWRPESEWYEWPLP
ncbi:MAG TPA: DUF4390 domain-containing protein [Thioalkalivibrio sp.]|nr:DUF4390 domain-containing protein [Thioalkalivibrio sp.]